MSEQQMYTEAQVRAMLEQVMQSALSSAKPTTTTVIPVTSGPDRTFGELFDDASSKTTMTIDPSTVLAVPTEGGHVEVSTGDWTINPTSFDVVSDSPIYGKPTDTGHVHEPTYNAKAVYASRGMVWSNDQHQWVMPTVEQQSAASGSNVTSSGRLKPHTPAEVERGVLDLMVRTGRRYLISDLITEFTGVYNKAAVRKAVTALETAGSIYCTTPNKSKFRRYKVR